MTSQTKKWFCAGALALFFCVPGAFAQHLLALVVSMPEASAPVQLGLDLSAVVGLILITRRHKKTS